MRYAFLSLFLLPFAFGCSASLSAPKQAELDKFECQVQAIAPVVEPVFDAAELLRQLYAGEASLPAVLRALEASEAEVRALLDRLGKCEAPAPSVPAGVDA